jgi:dihydrodipicolinate synthase/N-acetylneuraminate lyase
MRRHAVTAPESGAWEEDVKEIKGIILPLPTPFKADGEVDEALGCALADFEIGAGINALFLLGSFGQGPVMRLDQRQSYLETIVRHVRGRVPIIVHVGTADVFSTIELALHAKSVGVDAIAVVGPYYYSDHTEYEVIEHFKEVGERVAMPMLVYNNAEYSGYDITPPLMLKLHQEVPTIFGTKLSTNSFETALRYLAQMPKDFAVFGLSSSFMPAALYGIRGTIVPPQSSYPELAVSLWRAIEARNLEEAMTIQMIINELSQTTSRLGRIYGRAVQCEALRLRGFAIERFPRWKTKSLSDADREVLRAALAKAGVPVGSSSASREHQMA